MGHEEFENNPAKVLESVLSVNLPDGKVTI